MTTPLPREQFVPFLLVLALFTAFSIASAQNQSTSNESGAAELQKAAEVFAQARQIHSREGPPKALPLYERALALYQQEKDRKGEAITIGVMGIVFKSLGQHTRALEYFERSLRMKRDLGDRLEESKTLVNMGLLYWDTSAYDKALQSYNEALAIAKEIRDSKVEAAALNNLGLVDDELGDYRR